MLENNNPLPHEGCDVIERRAVDVSLLLQSVTTLLFHFPVNGEERSQLVRDFVNLDLLGIQGGCNLLSSTMAVCGFVITNPNAILYCEESGVRET